jgi:hypothetical protein
MPQINLIPDVLYEPSQPYHYIYDNLPLKNILARISLVNIQTDNNSEALMGTAGSTGSLADRLNVSIDKDGSIKKSSVDSSMHNIAHHEDGEKDGVEYVRMLAEERAKLALVAREANLLTVQVNDQVALSDGNIEIRDSSSIVVQFESPNIIKFHSHLPPDASHRHAYGAIPENQNTLSPDNKSFRTPLSKPYMEGSLRVYINGCRIGSGVYVPIFSAPGAGPSWMLFSVSSENAGAGTFVLNSSISNPAYNKIVIDFDMAAPFTCLCGSSSSSSSSSNPIHLV